MIDELGHDTLGEGLELLGTSGPLFISYVTIYRNFPIMLRVWLARIFGRHVCFDKKLFLQVFLSCVFVDGKAIMHHVCMACHIGFWCRNISHLSVFYHYVHYITGST